MKGDITTKAKKPFDYNPIAPIDRDIKRMKHRNADVKHAKTMRMTALAEALCEGVISAVFDNCFYVYQNETDDLDTRFFRVDIDMTKATLVELERK